MAQLLVLHGPNLNLLGTREPAVYGHTTLAQIDADLRARTEAAGHVYDSLQSNAFNTAFLLSAKGDRIPVENLDIRVTTSAADTLTIYTESYSLNSQL